VSHLWGIDGFKAKLSELAGSSRGRKLEFEHHSTTSDNKTLLVKGQIISPDGDRVILLLIEDITKRREAEEAIAGQKQSLQEAVTAAAFQLDRTQEELRGLTAHLFTVQEDERQRVSRELHDDVSQRLSALELMLKELTPSDSAQEETAQIAAIREHLHSLNNDVRQISHRLHPAILNDLGLSTAIKSLVAEFGEREGMPATFIGQDVPDQIPQPGATALYRITQEALRNVAKHAGKTHVKVLLKGMENMLRLEILDLGIGFDKEADLRPDGLGLISMKERARLAHGSFSITSSLGAGTQIVVEVPMDAHA
jgi:two-component system CheB/CheR fusion protein